MAEDWAILTGVLLMVLGLCIITFYLIPIQVRIALQPRDWLSRLRLILLAASSFIVLAAAPAVSNRVLRLFGVESVILGNISSISIGFCFLAFSIAMVSVYHYKKKE